MVEQPHNEETKAFAEELLQLLQKHNHISAIWTTAILAQFAGKVGAIAVLEGSANADSVADTIEANSDKAFDEQAEKIRASSDNPCTCSECMELKKRLIN